MKSALDVHRALLADGVPHEMIRLRTPVLTAADLPGALGVDASSCVAVRCYTASRADDDVMVCVLVRAGDVPDPSSLLAALDAASVRPATSAEVNQATDYAAGLVSPLCLPDDVVLLADAALGSADVLYAPTGETRVALSIGVKDLLVASGALVTTLTAGPLVAGDGSEWDRGERHEGTTAPVLSLDSRRPVGARRTG